MGAVSHQGLWRSVGVSGRVRKYGTVSAALAVGASLLLVPSGAAGALDTRVLAYVANNGGGVSVLDTATNAITTALADSPGDSPYGVGVAFDGGRAYVTNVRNGTLTVIDTPTNTIDAAVPVGDGPAGVVVAPDGGHVYVSNYRAGTVSVVDAATLATVATIPVGPNADGVALTPDGGLLYVAHDVPGPGTVSVVDTATNTEIAEFPTGNTPTALAVTPDGRTLVVVNKFSDNVALVDTADNTVTGTIPVGFTPHGIAITPDGTRAFVPNSEGDNVSVLDLVNRAPLALVRVGDRPISAALTPDGTRAYVTNFTSGTVSVLDAATLAVESTVPVGVAPVGIAIHAVPPARTRLTTGTAVIVPRGGLTVTGITATLTEQHTGRAVPGKVVSFTTVKGTKLCTAVTNAAGTATCDARVPVQVGVATLLEGYTAAYAGDLYHGPSAAHGATVRR
ncbi:MAG: YncE family protein [Saccharothrix sp.]|nr:YncE family protein [Saccharothrix sp.]